MSPVNKTAPRTARNAYENILNKAISGNKKSVNESYANNNSANLPTDVSDKNVTGANMGVIEEGDFAGDAVFNNIRHQIYINKEGKLIISDRKGPSSDECVPNSEIDLNSFGATDFFGRTLQLNKSQHIMLDDGTNIYLKPSPFVKGGIDVTITNRLKNADDKNGNFMAVTTYNPQAKGEPLAPVAANDQAEAFEADQSNYKGGTIYINSVTKGDFATVQDLRDNGKLAATGDGYLSEAYGTRCDTEEDKDDGDDDRKNYFALQGLKGGDRATSCRKDDIGGTWVVQGDEQGAFLGADHRTWVPAAAKYKTIDQSHRITETQPLPSGSVAKTIDGSEDGADTEESPANKGNDAPAKPGTTSIASSSSYPPSSYPVPGSSTAADRAEKERLAKEAEERAAENAAAGSAKPANSTPAKAEPAMA